ncbi:MULTISPECIES: hypothetical protein [unclassified Nocardioides]|uniref:hypothetical protein n=1 Tax=unclassified Nocardioides TaxID=2615069 RepID=UPI002666ED50|nr:hypothetical protein [Nocardioides sp. Arc9.136]WKN48434.1 hypothetical protein OSR43_20720 [Nocardioides sp. Arc9.136]
MQESTVTTGSRTRPTMCWVPVVDSRGRTHMEARWLDEGVALGRTTATYHAA